MHIKNFIKNYPCTIFLTMLLFVSIAVIFLEGKVYASKTSNTPGCEERCMICTTPNAPAQLPVYCSDRGSAFCECPKEFRSFRICMKNDNRISTIIKCAGEKSQGCSSVPCTPSDCTAQTETNCGTCTVYILKSNYPCDGNGWNDCGKCDYNTFVTENYEPVQYCYQ